MPYEYIISNKRILVYQCRDFGLVRNGGRRLKFSLLVVFEVFVELVDVDLSER